MTDPHALPVMVGVVQTLAVNLTGAQAQQALTSVLQRIGETTDAHVLRDLVQALPTRITGPQAQLVFSPLLKEIHQVKENLFPAQDDLAVLAEALQALAPNLTGAQAVLALPSLLEWIGKSNYAGTRQALAKAVTASAAKLTEEQVQKALAPLLQQIGEAKDADAFQRLAEAVAALAPKLTQAQAHQAFVSLLPKPDLAGPHALPGLVEVTRILAANVTDAELSQLLEQIRTTTNAAALQTLSQGVLALAPKLTGVQSRRARDVVGAKLAWAETEAEAAGWAQVLVLLLPPKMTASEVQEVVTVLRYPTSAGQPTNVLLDGIRARAFQAREQYSDLATFFSWIGNTYPDVQLSGSLVCPPPLQPELTCPVSLE
jgi:hypothetical protein